MRFALLLVSAIAIGPTSAFGIEISLAEWDSGSELLSTSLVVEATNEFCCGGFSSTVEPSTLPFTDSHLADSGGVTSETSYQLSESGIEIGPIEHFRLRRSSAISDGVVYFSLDEDGAYSVRGNYALTGGREIWLHASLWDLTSGTLLFDSKQVSVQTPDQTFTLGEMQGDSANVQFGARDRMVNGGHVYRLTYRALIGSSEAGDGDASATGGISLTVLPEPLSGLPAGIGLLILAAARTRGSKAALP